MQEIYQSSKNWLLSVRIFEDFEALMTVVHTLPRQLIRSLQIKKIVINTSYVLCTITVDTVDVSTSIKHLHDVIWTSA